MSWQQLVYAVLTDTRVYRRALGALALATAIALLVFLLVVSIK